MAGPNEERAQLRSLAARHGWRLRPGSREGLYDRGDNTGLLAENLIEREVRLLCAGIVGLGSLRQPL